MSLSETSQLIRVCVDRVMCLSRVQIDARARFVFGFSLLFTVVLTSHEH